MPTNLITLPFASALPLPLGKILMFPLEPSVIVIAPEFVPEFVSKTKSYGPLVVSVAGAPPLPKTVSPVPFGLIFIPTLVSPVAEIVGPFPVEALAKVN